MATNKSELKSDEVNVWIEQEAIHIRALDSYGDPIELAIFEARKLAETLLKLADSLDAE